MMEDYDYLDFPPYIDFRFKNKSLKEVAILSRLGEEEAKQEFFCRLQPLIEKLSLVYSIKFGYYADDYVDALYLAAYKAINLYDNEQGDFEHFIRVYFSNSAKWLTSDISRKKKRYPEFVQGSEIDNLTEENFDNIAEYITNNYKEQSEKADIEIYLKRLRKYTEENCTSEEKIILHDIAYDKFNADKAAKLLNLSSSGAYRHIISLFKRLKNNLDK